MENQGITDPSAYDTAQLVQWYVDLRNNKSEVRRSIEPTLNQIDAQMSAIETELNKRIMASGATSMRTPHGTVARVLKHKYTVADPYLFRLWVQNNPQQGIALLRPAVTQDDVANYIEEGNALPDGLAIDSSFEISVRRK